MKKNKETLIIKYKFFENSMTFNGYRYLYQIENKFKTSGSFCETLLSEYEKIFNIKMAL